MRWEQGGLILMFCCGGVHDATSQRLSKAHAPHADINPRALIVESPLADAASDAPIATILYGSIRLEKTKIEHMAFTEYRLENPGLGV